LSQLQDALNTAWDVEAQPSQGLLGTIRSRLLSFAIILVIGVLLLASVVINTVIAAVSTVLADLLPQGVQVTQGLNLLVTLGVTTVLFAIIYKVLPDAEIEWRDVGVGAVMTAALFLLGQVVVSRYLSYSSVASAYGVAGSVIVILLWVYYSAQIFLFGAEFTQVYATRHGSRIRPNYQQDEAAN
jgi:membrane protein